MTRRRRVACLHTAESNVAIFDTAATGLDLDLRHIVREDLLAAAAQAGSLTTAIIDDTEATLAAAASDADFVLLACSTLGPIADQFAHAVPVLRIDRALAEAAIQSGGLVAVLYTFPGTLQATETLFREVAAGSAAEIEMQLVEDAWAIFKAGQHARYFAMIAAAADKASAAGARSIAFAQASMAPAADLCRVAKPLTSPRAGLLAAAK